MTDLEIEIEQIYHGFFQKCYPYKPTHFIISKETYRKLRKEYNQFTSYLRQDHTNENGVLITKTTLRNLPFIVDHDQEGHYIAAAFITTDRRI